MSSKEQKHRLIFNQAVQGSTGWDVFAEVQPFEGFSNIDSVGCQEVHIFCGFGFLTTNPTVP